MVDRSKKRKTCCAVIVNFFAKLHPSQLLLGYLYLVSFFAGAQETVTKTCYSPGNKQTIEPSSVCKYAPPRCTLSVRGIFSHGKIDRFNVTRECDLSEEVTYVGRGSLATQMTNQIFHGNSICNKTVTNKVLKDPIHSMFRHNTDYSVGLENEDQVELTYRRLFSDPNRP